MPKTCSIKRFISFLLVIAILCTCGCKKQDIPSSTRGEWIEALVNCSGIETAENEYMQAAVEWGIIKEDEITQINEPLTREYVAYTIYHLIGTLDLLECMIKDIDQCNYPEEVKAVVQSDLMTLDNGYFRPAEITTVDDQMDVIEKAIIRINSRFDEEEDFDIDFTEGMEPELVEPQEFDPEAETMIIDDPKDHKVNELVVINDQNKPFIYKVNAINDNEVKLASFDVLRDTDRTILSGNTELDFSDCVFQDIGSVPETSVNESKITGVSFLPLSKTFEKDGYKITLSSTKSAITASVSKEMKNNSVLYGTIRIRNMHCNYQWLSEKEDIRNCFFRINYESEESFGLKKSYDETLYADFSQLKKEDLLNSLKQAFKTEDNTLQKTITLYTVEVPLPDNPLMSVTLSLQLQIDINGSIQLQFVQTNEAGFEIRNGKIRIIKNNDSDGNASINANTSLTAGLNVGLSLSKQKLMDFSVDTGVDAGVVPTVHLFNQSGEKNTASVDLPYDYIEDMSVQRDDLALCCDISAKLIMYLNLNSTNTVAGKFGFSKRFTMMEAEGPSFIRNMNGHFENGMKVTSCTRKNKTVLPGSDNIQISKRIRLRSYTYSLDPNESEPIEIYSLPEGYTISDLIYLTSDSKVVSVDSNGILHAHTTGSSVITVKTKDLKHYITCNVFVKD